MEELDNSGGPAVPEASRRRRFGSRRTSVDPALEGHLDAAQRVILDRFEQGLEAVGQQAVALMREATEDVWNATGAELGDLKQRVIAELSRDQAIRGLIAHSDERFMTLDARVARIEANLDTIDRAAQGLSEVLDEARRTEAMQGLAAQTIDQRLGVVEEALQSVAAMTRDLQARIARGLQVVYKAAAAEGEAGFPLVQEQIEGVQKYILRVAEYLGERDRALTGWLQASATENATFLREQVRASIAGIEERILGDESDLSEAIGAAVGAHVATLTESIGRHAAALRDALAVTDERVDELAGTLDQRIAAATTAVSGFGERLESVRVSGEHAVERLSATLHERIADLTDDMRAETEVMRARLLERASEAGEHAMRGVDERLGRLSELVASALGWAVDEVEGAIRRETLRSVAVGMADFLAGMDRRFVDLDEAVEQGLARTSRELAERLQQTAEGTGRQVHELGERLERTAEGTGRQVHELAQRLDRTAQGTGRQVDEVAARVAEVIERAETISARVGDVGERMERRLGDVRGHVDSRLDRLDLTLQAGLGALEESVSERTAQSFDSILDTRLRPAAADITAAVEAMRASLEDSVTRAMTDRIASLASMMRSDNRVLADRLSVVEEQAPAKEAIRAINELAAALPSEIGNALDRRLDILGELFRQENKQTIDMVTRAARALADRLDKTATSIGERFDREVEIVVDSIGDTMASLATGLQRSTPTRRP